MEVLYIISAFDSRIKVCMSEIIVLVLRHVFSHDSTRKQSCCGSGLLKTCLDLMAVHLGDPLCCSDVFWPATCHNPASREAGKPRSLMSFSFAGQMVEPRPALVENLEPCRVRSLESDPLL